MNNNKNISLQLLKKIKKLKDKKYRELYDLHLVEGIKNNIEIIRRKKYPEFLLYSKEIECPEIFNNKNFETYKIKEKELKQISTIKTPQPIVGVYKNELKEEINFEKAENLILLDRIQDPENFGAIIRLIIAFNFDGILLLKNSVDIFNPKVVRAATGLHLFVPIKYLSNENEIKEIKNKFNYKIFCADVNGEYLEKNKFTNEKKILVFGNEGSGISKSIKEFADKTFTIKLFNNVDSLNIATAVAIFLWEIKRG
ncbi:MAG TPA: RNA methyltransferase [bacterium]|nr:RNA methyltransferase [bacterium]HOL48196.1 RNA methyltransferase [bacterium]HPQ19603.1 RNA methyltransferase [bacterium]